QATVTLEPMGAGWIRQELPGQVQGRVLIARGPSIHCVLTIDPGGRQARLGWAGGPWSGTEAVATRLILTDSGNREATRSDPLLAGGLVCLLPGNGGSTREVLVYLQYAPRKDGGVLAGRTFISLDRPRKVWSSAYPGDGLMAHVLDRRVLLEARQGSSVLRKQKVTLDGKTSWLVLAPGWSKDTQDLSPDRLRAEYYESDPDSEALPLEVVEVAERSTGGSWRPKPNYLKSFSSLTSAQALLEGGKVGQIELVHPEAPPLEHFLVLSESSIPIARWRTQAILEVKNRTLPKILRDYKTGDLNALAIRLEKHLLDLSHESDQLRDRAQRSVEGSTLSTSEMREDKREIGQTRSQLQDPNLDEETRARLQNRIGELERNVSRLQSEQRQSQTGIDQLREMSTVYKERIEVLKPFLPAIKEELANRGK
ncbi:MAG TPA: hypothetical protein VMU54_14620, partial [Planctomycetota bacterium]|nr:hypothetical protein [Planctomycetota bacterium]